MAENKLKKQHKAEITQDNQENMLVTENQEHNTKKVSLGPNTKQ